jgi:hypothetical protein
VWLVGAHFSVPRSSSSPRRVMPAVTSWSVIEPLPAKAYRLSVPGWVVPGCRAGGIPGRLNERGQARADTQQAWQEQAERARDFACADEAHE